MKQYILHDPWCIIEEGFHPEYNRISESLFSIGNGRMGQRANFEEAYSGETLQGHYVAGIYYPDKTRVGWWKNGYPEYFAKVLNAPSWINIYVQAADEIIDLNKAIAVTDFRRTLNMREGYLERFCVVELSGGRKIEIHSLRFCSVAEDEIGAIKYSIKPLNFSGTFSFTLPIDADVKNADANYEEKFWKPIRQEANSGTALVIAETAKTNFRVSTAMHAFIEENNQRMEITPEIIAREKYAANIFTIDAKEGNTYTIYKTAAILSSENHPVEKLLEDTYTVLKQAVSKGFETLLEEQKNAWQKKWEVMDIEIEDDIAAQQGIRFNIFQLHQTYTGEDERLNIGPKGFTGEKYGGATYWDTEAYCLPFYLSTDDEKVARNLLLYRYKQLDKAIENAARLGFTGGAALYPMVTINGEECHNEWEITFEEIHRNGAIAYAIWNYCNYTGDWNYLAEYGLEVLIAIARFWSQRVNWSEDKNQFVILGVTGPNEYENNVNNNWYTNKLAAWCLQFTENALQIVSEKSSEKKSALLSKIKFKKEEITQWKNIYNNMYYPFDEKLNIFLQQDGYMDKAQITVENLSLAERPINQKWSWDRILRSCFIKQADVLQGIYFFEDEFDTETIRRNFEFYEARTVHESSLSPCVHCILAARIGKKEKAYEMYLRTARLDLDDYNNDTKDGCHITSMAGTWMSIVYGFAGMSVRNGELYFSPFLPEQWSGFRFIIRFRKNRLQISVCRESIEINNLDNGPVDLYLFNNRFTIQPKNNINLSL